MQNAIKILSIILFCQLHSYGNDIIWEKCNGSSAQNNIVEDSTGNIYIFGQTQDNNQSFSTYLDKYDPNMQLLWHQDANSNEYFINYIDDNQSYFSYNTINDSTIFIKKYNERNLVWISDTIKKLYFTPNIIRKTKRGNYFFAQGSYSQSFIINLNNSGQRNWTKETNFYTNNYSLSIGNYVFDFIEDTTNNQIITIENSYKLSPSFNTTQDYITLKSLIDSNGNIIKIDTSYYFPSYPSNFARELTAGNYPNFIKNTSSYYPEFYSTLYYNKSELVFKTTDVNMNIVNVDTIKDYLYIGQENLKQTISDSTYFLFTKSKNNIYDSINDVSTSEIEFMLYNIKGELKWSYTSPYRLSINYYNAIIHQLSDKKFLIELNDEVSKKIYRLLIENFEVKWHTATIDTIIKNQETLYATITYSHIYNLCNNPSSNYNNNKDQTFYKFQEFYKTNDSTYPVITNSVYAINLENGSKQEYMKLDSFALGKYLLPFFDIYYYVTFFKVLPDNKLFLETITKIKCDTINFNSYLVILGPTITNINQNKVVDSKLNIYPNPNNGSFIISYESKTNSNIQLQLIDVTGNIIYQENKQHQNKTEFSVNQNNLAKGIYWIKLSDENNINSRAIIVQ